MKNGLKLAKNQRKNVRADWGKLSVGTDYDRRDSVDIELWKQISTDYNIAKQCLWCPKNASGWHREEDKGTYHLWKAYYEASNSDEKDYLLYARILMMMYHERQHIEHSYTRFHKYIAPAKEAYDKAITDGYIPSDKEIEKIKYYFESLKYELEKTSNDSKQIEEGYKCIDGLEAVHDFCFHDSKPIHFEHNKDAALLKLDYDGMVVSFMFMGLYDVEVNGDPTTNWISDFYCYPAFHNKSLLQFDIGYYRILCEKISVVSVEK